jgi:hypothetical protein
MPEQKLTSGVLSRGVVDGPDDIYCPEGACLQADGFEFRRGYPRTEYGREDINAPAPIVASSTIKDLARWVRADGTERFYVIVNGGIWESTANSFASTTLRSTINVGASTATRSGNTVTITGAKCLLSAQVGDYFYYDADSSTGGGSVASVDSATQLTLSAYAGSGTSGNFTLWRKLATGNAYLLVMGDRLWVFDGTNIPHWYGDPGDGTFEFRPAGLPAPATPPTATLAAGGALGGGDYWWAYSYEDRGERVSNPIYSHKCTATASDKCTLSITDGPAWATKIRVWRTKVGGSLFYSTYSDYGSSNPLLVNGTPTDATPSVITIASDSATLVTDMHIHRYAKFATSGTSYRITDNDGTTVTAATNASGETSGDRITITGGYDIDQCVSSGFVDLMADGSLDVDYQEPDENTQPVAKLTHPIVIDGGGRWMAYEDTTQTKEWFSGRNTDAHIETGAATGGLGEYDYAPQSHHAGQQDGHEIIQNLELGGRAFALKDTGPWEVYKEPIDVSGWDINPVELASGQGIVAPRSVAKKSGVAYWYGMDSMQADIIRFDGNVAYGMMRRHDPRLGTSRMRAMLGSWSSITSGTAAVFQGRYYLSYYSTGSSTANDKTLRYDLQTHTIDRQPWGCGIFAAPYNTSDSFLLICGDPVSTTAETRSVLGTQADLGSNISRTLIPRAFTFGVDIETAWLYIYIRGINGETVTAPTVAYSVDGLPFDDSNKTWETTVAGDTWRTATGNYVQKRSIQAGERSNILHVRITHTDAKDWGIYEIEVVGVPARLPLPIGA